MHKINTTSKHTEQSTDSNVLKGEMFSVPLLIPPLIKAKHPHKLLVFWITDTWCWYFCDWLLEWQQNEIRNNQQALYSPFDFLLDSLENFRFFTLDA